MTRDRALGGAFVFVLLSACSSDPPADPGPACANVPPRGSPCTPLYEPSFDNVFTKTLRPTCGRSGASCHAATGRQGGLAFVDPDESYRLLLETTQDVRAGDPGCSVLLARLVATDANVRMPPGRALEDAEQCAITQWIESGAKR